jgi:hypothetical protein
VFVEAGELHKLAPALLVAIASRESNMGASLSEGTGDDGNAWTIMQIDQRFHKQWAADHSPTDHRAGIRKAASYLRGEIDHFGRLRPSLASYNASRGSVEDALARGVDVNAVTTGGDYVSDTLRRRDLIMKVRPSLSESGARFAASPFLVGLLGVGAGISYAVYQKRLTQ